MFFISYRILKGKKAFKTLNAIWCLLAYSIRALCLDDAEYVHVTEVNYCLREVYMLWDRYFGPENCSYNVHQLCHLHDIREARGPLPSWSALPFEGNYAALRRVQTACRNPAKQILTELNMRSLSHYM